MNPQTFVSLNLCNQCTAARTSRAPDQTLLANWREARVFSPAAYEDWCLCCASCKPCGSKPRRASVEVSHNCGSCHPAPLRCISSEVHHPPPPTSQPRHSQTHSPRAHHLPRHSSFLLRRGIQVRMIPWCAQGIKTRATLNA
jgi:hypothetical protein